MQRTSNGQATTNKEVKNVNNEKKEEGICLFTLDEFLNAGVLVGLTDVESRQCFEHYRGQNFCYGNGLPIADAQGACVRWRNNRGRFDKSDNVETLDEQFARLEKEGQI